MSKIWQAISDEEPTNEELYQDTTEYKLIYIYWIDDEAHKGLLKIGDASLKSSKQYDCFPVNCSELNKAARIRIGAQTGTAGIMYHLCHTEIAVRKKGPYLEPFRDKAVHKILENSGIKKVIIPVPGAKATEWFQVDLDTARNAIAACKQGRKTLLSTEIVPEEKREIVLREEQEDAIKKTIACFKINNQMLWNAKMRYGKTATSLTFVKRELSKYPKTIIITHRPVVESGWREDFNIVFKKHECLFLSKDKESDNSDDSPQIDQANEKQLKKAQLDGTPFIYFASIQDLRGSNRVGGKFNKNNVVFDLDWDLIINDEAHEGTQTELGIKVAETLKKNNTKILSLSGTPFNIISQFDDDSVYTWDYPMEQTKKREWDSLNPGDPNPYADLPQMHIYTYDLGDIIKGYSPELEDKAFNFTEFFRTWTGDFFNDGKALPNDDKIGEFIHKSDVKHFLDLITTSSNDSAYPFSTPQYRDMFHHTLWMVPGVKEAKALEAMLREHPVFKNFKVANVAGEGDSYEETHYDSALEKVRTAIKENDYTITLSCGKLTTGVTVREWTACFMLSGSYSTGASNYLQTIFRVQSPGQINGKTKEHSYVFDFAPDRTLVVLAEAAKVSRKGGSGGLFGEDKNREAMRTFLNFCPVISIKGTRMVPYSVNTLMEQVKKVYAERAIRTGFEDTSIYNERLLALDQLDIEEFNKLKAIIGQTKAQKKTSKLDMTNNGFTQDEYEETQGIKNKPKNERTEADLANLARLKKQREERGKAISILRGISVRMPLLIYGADVPFNQDIDIDKFVSIVDDESWNEFMPNKVSKEVFQKFTKYYDRDVFIAAGKEIRRLTKKADMMLPTQRVQSITKLFSFFKNPDKETVLTPWRVVNMHMGDCLGGYDFFNEDHDETIEEPRFIDQGEVTQKTVANVEAKILEINSKTGLYPLFVAYSIYRAKCKEHQKGLTEELHNQLWNETVQNNVFVICKTEMAKFITKRTLLGYKQGRINAHFFDDLINQFKNKSDQVVKKILNQNYWGIKGSNNMKFDAIVGNPPYQVMDTSEGLGATPIFPFFFTTAKALLPQYISMIIPARWYAGGKGLDSFRDSFLHDKRIIQLTDFENSKECFPNADIAGGLCYFTWKLDAKVKSCEINNVSEKFKNTIMRPLDEYPVFIRSNKAIPLLKKVLLKTKTTIENRILSQKPFGFRTYERGEKEISQGKQIQLVSSEGIGYVARESVIKNQEYINYYKTYIGRFVPSNGEISVKPGEGYRVTTTIQKLKPNQVCTETYIVVGVFKSEKETDNFISYYKCRFTRFMLRLAMSSVNISKESFRFVPEQDFSIVWTDSMLYEKYGLTEEEISFIEYTIKPMA